MKSEAEHCGAKSNFIIQQGVADAPSDNDAARFEALQFQPRIVASLVLVGVVFQSPAIFLTLAAVLWWGALVPQKNPFDLFYNLTLGARPGGVLLKPAPGPRRFAQGMAGAFSLITAILLLLQWRLAAYAFELLFLSAVAALVFGRFCLGSFVFHLLHGRLSFALRTLPWAREDQAVEDSSSGR